MLNVMSFNIRCCDDGEGYLISDRAPRLIKTVEKYDPDVIAFQEYRPPWEEFINENTLSAYRMFLKYRSETIDVEGTPILWKKDKFKLIESGYFWLSDTPDVQSKGWDELYDCHRMCVYTVLSEIKTGNEFCFINTHFGFGDKCQSRSADLIYNYLKEKIDKMPVIFAGDFNCRPEMAGYKQLCRYFTDVNEATKKDYGYTYHGYMKENATEIKEHIDYCFINDKVKPLDEVIIRDKVDNMYVSDHYGLSIKVDF